MVSSHGSQARCSDVRCLDCARQRENERRSASDVLCRPAPPELVDALGAPLRQPEFPGTFSEALAAPVTLDSLAVAAELIKSVRAAADADEHAFFWRATGWRFREKSRSWFGRAS